VWGRAPANRTELGEVMLASPATGSVGAVVVNRDLDSSGAAQQGQGGWPTRDRGEGWNNEDQSGGKRREGQ
jgi:hypothetical protein